MRGLAFIFIGAGLLIFDAPVLAFVLQANDGGPMELAFWAVALGLGAIALALIAAGIRMEARHRE